MERKYPDLTPVKHRSDKYQGWVDGITKIDTLFTGNQEVPWQYRVFLPDGTRKVAPEEDLEHVSQSPELPPRDLLDRYVESFEGESELHSLGYNLSDLNPEQRQRLLIYCALPMLGSECVLKNLCDILWRKVRQNKVEKLDKYHNAIEQWSHDLDFVLSLKSIDIKSLSQEIVNYVSAVKDHIERYTDIQSTLSAEAFIASFEKELSLPKNTRKSSRPRKKKEPE